MDKLTASLRHTEYPEKDIPLGKRILFYDSCGLDIGIRSSSNPDIIEYACLGKDGNVKLCTTKTEYVSRFEVLEF